jgi:hypothetical protein
MADMVERSANMTSPILRWRAWPVLLTIILPLAVSAAYAVSVDLITGTPDWAQLLRVSVNKEPIDLFARDIGGRMQFAIASTLLRLAACAAVIFALGVLARRASLRQAISIVVATAIAYAVIYGIALFVDQQAMSKITPVLDHISNALQQNGHAALAVDTALRLNQLAAAVGGGALLACFTAVALRAAAGDTDESRLQSRMRDLATTTIFAAVFLVLLTAVNKSLADWPQAFLVESQQKSYAYLAGAIGSFWGTSGTLTLVFALTPAFFALKADIDAAASGRAANWKTEKGLEFDMKSGIGAAIAAVAPILTVPGIDLASKLLH